MAKKENEVSAEEKPAETEEKEKPAKKEREPLGLPVILGIIFGILLILVLSVRFIILPYVVDGLNPELRKEKEKAEKAEKAKAAADPLSIMSPEFKEKETKTLETGRITTNPKGSTQFIVINLATIYIPKDEDALEALNKENGKVKEGEGVPPAFTQTMIRAKGVVNSVLGSMTVEELQSNRDSLRKVFVKEFKELFGEKKCIVRDVIIQEFMIQ